MNKTRIKIAFIALCVIACFAYTVTTLLRALNAPYEAEKSAVSVPYVSSHSGSSDLPKVQMRSHRSMVSGHGSPLTINHSPLTSHPLTSTAPQSPFTYRHSSATMHSIGGGGATGGGTAGNKISNQKSQITNQSFTTVVPLLAVNSSAFSVNRDLTETDGESVVGKSMRKIAPPDDGGSTIGGTPNIAPPDDGGELLGSPVGEIPILLIALLGGAYALSIRRIRRLKQA